MFRIEGVPHRYDWGSTTAIQRLLGEPSDGSPLAEVWYGAHPSAPSPVVDGGTRTLDAVIAAEPVRLLGDSVADRFGRLPFLLKLLAPGRSVSLQIHPSLDLARAGFAAEDAAGVPRDARERTFRDDNHKPEMVYPLTRFTGLIAFRPADVAANVLERFTVAPLPALARQLRADGAPAMRAVLNRLVGLDAATVDAVACEAGRLTGSWRGPGGDPYLTASRLAEEFPHDVGVAASLLLNRVTLEPGSAVFVGDGVPHAYQAGLCVELMANSDNVIRAGLTSKHVDADALVRAVDVSATAPTIVAAAPTAVGVSDVRPPISEFALERVDAGGSTARASSAHGPRIVLGVDGGVEVECAGQPFRLAAGHALFVGADEPAVCVTGRGSVVIAHVPDAR